MIQMTLIEYVMRLEQGSPKYRSEDVAHFLCPMKPHGQATFKTFPTIYYPRPTFYCRKCNFGGDIFDLMAIFFPSESYEEHKRRIAEYTSLYKDKFRRPPLNGVGSNTEEISGLVGKGIRKFRDEVKAEHTSDDYDARVKRAYVEMLQFCLWKPGVGPQDYNYVFAEMYDVRLRDLIDLHKSLAVEMETLSPVAV